MRGDMCALTPSPGSESGSRSSPASREARRARFFAARGAGAGTNAATAGLSLSPSPSPSRVSPEDEPRAAQRAPTPSSSPIREATPSRTRAQREWSPEETPARALSMPSPTPKKSPKKSPKRSPPKTDVDSDARLLAFVDDGFADENDVSAVPSVSLAIAPILEPTESPANSPSDWLRLDDVTPPDVSAILRRERLAIGADAARSEARLSKFRSRADGEDTQPNVRRIAELARPKRFSDENPKNHKTRSPLKATERKPKSAGYSAATRARLERLAAKKRGKERFGSTRKVP